MISSISIFNNYNYYEEEYDNLSDEELILEIRTGNDQAERYLFKRYSFIIKRISSSFFIIGGSLDDLFQEAMIGLIKAISRFDDNFDCSFRSFAEVCIRRQIISAIRKAKPYEILNRNSSFYDFFNESEELTLLDEYADLENNPENVLIHKEEKLQYLSLTSEILSSLEKKVLTEYGKGKTYEEISKELNKNIKSIDNAIQRAKKKICCNIERIME